MKTLYIQIMFLSQAVVNLMEMVCIKQLVVIAKPWRIQYVCHYYYNVLARQNLRCHDTKSHLLFI